jgi:FkbM family methyltransferase
MSTLFRSAFVNLGYKAIANGIRFPSFEMAQAFRQWSRLIDLTHQLGINVFLDVGANRGFFSKHLRMSGYRGYLFSFEPVADDHDRIEALAAKDSRWKTCCCALGSENTTKEFHVNFSGEQTVLSSFLSLKAPTDKTRTVTVEVRRLDAILPRLLMEIESPRIFLKMDTQGFDNEVIEGASGCLDQVLGIQSEISVIPLYDHMPHYTESLVRYERLGFALVDLFVVNRRDGFVVEYDCMMARPGAW